MSYNSGDVLLNKYKIEKELGKGAFGEVFLAEHIQLGAKRALKVLRRDAPGMGSTLYMNYHGRFNREAQLGAKIDDPHVIGVHDIEPLDPIHEMGGYVLVMEYAQGGTLLGQLDKARKEKKPLAADDALRIALDAATGLAALHALDVVHRDVKPSNIFFGEDGRARIGDLGLAQIPGGDSKRDELGSLAGPHPGTPAYMSPEQTSTTDYLTPASDVYSLGVVLFEMLTLRMVKSLKEGTRLRNLRPNIDERVDALVMQMLSEDPKERPWDGQTVARRLEEILKKRRHWDPNLWFLIPAFLVLLILSGIWWMGGGRQPIIKENQGPPLINQVESSPVPIVEVLPVTPVPLDITNPANQASAQLPGQSVFIMNETRLREMDGMTEVFIPAGSFIMGANEDSAVQGEHPVTLTEYWIDRTEVTNEMYARCVADGVCTEPKLASSYSRENYYQNQAFMDFPVIYVDWQQASDYCQWAGARLPTEAEWEKAARGNDGQIYPWGNQSPDSDLANFASNGGDTTPVGNYTEGMSPHGVLDLAGNVWEWVGVWDDESNQQSSGNAAKKMIRGGSWASSSQYLMSAGRRLGNVNDSNDDLGFRCATDSKTQSTQNSSPTIPQSSTQVRELDKMVEVYIPEGVFTMGSNNGGVVEKPEHKISLNDFWIDQSEVTNEMYLQCVSVGKCTLPMALYSNTRGSYFGDSQYHQYPVVNVNWSQANNYCGWVGGRLPTEAEWEKAARGSDGRNHPWGYVFNGLNLNYCDDRCALDWSDIQFDDGYKDTAPVGSYLPGASPYGVLDMAGNVWEWVFDWFDEDYYENSPLSNPSGPDSGTYRVIRGGSWDSIQPDTYTTKRSYYSASVFTSNLGFRCARDTRP